MTQPPFWLRITPTYVIENFEDLLIYVSRYSYLHVESPESDFNRTVTHLSEVAGTLCKTAFESNSDELPEWETGRDKSLRIVAAAILAERKRGRVAYDLILGLIKMMLFAYNVPVEFRDAFARNICACARHDKLRHMSIYFKDLEPDNFSEARLCTHIANIEWDKTGCNRAYFEGSGTVIFDGIGVEITPLNHDKVLETERKRRRCLDTGVNVRICDTDLRRVSSTDVNEILEWWPSLMRAMQSVKPSKEKKLKRYSEGESLEVRLVNRNGIKLECESLDPEYEKIHGKLWLEPLNLGVTRDNLLENLKIGDILPVQYYPDDECVFVISNSIEEEKDFKIFVNKNKPDNYVRGIFMSKYAYGTRWLSDCGLQVNILHKYHADIDIDAHSHEGACLKIIIDEMKEDSKGNVVINGHFLPESEQNLDDVMTGEFRHRANDVLAKSLINYMHDWADTVMPQQKSDSETAAPRQTLVTMGMLLLQNAEQDSDLSSAERVAMLVAAAAIFQCAGADDDTCIALRELSFQKAIIGFAQGQSPMSLTFSADRSISANPRTLQLCGIIDNLKRYKESKHSITVSDNLIGKQYDLIEDLVDASNTLINKIDVAELSRIKKSIAKKLGVADVFRDTARSHQFYGYEGDTLEFKISCVIPPHNRQTGSTSGDMEIQAFAMLKTICALLNSQAGGDLLIGVNDYGYATGIHNDIDILYDNKVIPERNADRLRIYLKNLFDQSFLTNDGNVSGNAITVGNVLVNVETTADGKEIIRVKVNPYPYDVVRIKKEHVPQGGKDVYYRSSGSSEPLDNNGVRNIRMMKLNALDPNESKTAFILEAIDQKKQLLLCEYRSRSGISDRLVEPVCLMLDNTSLLAFDHKHREMRLFKLSRIGKVVKTGKNWVCEKKHRRLPVDIFGMLQSAGYPGTLTRVKMSDFALMLLREEFPEYKNDGTFRALENRDSDRNRYPYIVEMNIYHPSGLMRFVNGLPDETLIVSQL